MLMLFVRDVVNNYLSLILLEKKVEQSELGDLNSYELYENSGDRIVIRLTVDRL